MAKSLRHPECREYLMFGPRQGSDGDGYCMCDPTIAMYMLKLGRNDFSASKQKVGAEMKTKIGLTISDGTELRDVAMFWEKRNENVHHEGNCTLDRLKILMGEYPDADFLVNIWDDRRDHRFPANKDKPDYHTWVVLDVNDKFVEVFCVTTVNGGILHMAPEVFLRYWAGNPDRDNGESDWKTNFENGTRNFLMVVGAETKDVEEKFGLPYLATKRITALPVLSSRLASL